MILDNFAKELKSNAQLPIDADSLLTHHLLVTGATGSGKSTSLLKLIESLQKNQQATVIFDPTGEYQSVGDAIRYKLGVNANLDFNHLMPNEIANLLGDFEGELVSQITAAIISLKIQKNVLKKSGVYHKINQNRHTFHQVKEQLKMSGSDYDAQKLIDQVIQEFVVPYQDDRADYQLLGQELDYQVIKRYWSKILSMQEHLVSQQLEHIFNRNQSDSKQPQIDLFYVLKLFAEHQGKSTLIIDVSELMVNGPQSRLILSILLRQLLLIRVQGKARFPLTIFLDEAHRFLPAENQQTEDSGLFKLVREGRKYGLYVVLSTQSPLDLSVKLRGQFGSVLAHQLNDQAEVNSVIADSNIDAGIYQKFLPGEGVLKLTGQSEKTLITIPVPHTTHHTESPRFN